MSIEEDLYEGKIEMAEAKERLNKTMSKGLRIADKILTGLMNDKRNVGLMEAAEVAEEARDAVRNVKEIRPDVLWFAQLMEDKLRANDYKPGWKNCTPEYLYSKLIGKVSNLYSEICNGSGDQFKEAANVANYAMMIADVTRPLFSHEHPPERGTACEWGPSPVEAHDRHEYLRLKRIVEDQENKVRNLTDALTEIYNNSPGGTEAERVAGKALYGETWSNGRRVERGVVIRHIFTCSICGTEEHENFRWAEGLDIPKPQLPEDWHWVNGLLVCPNHSIVVDGEKV